MVSNQQQKLPTFEEGQDVDIFLRSFEKMAGLHKWPRDQWAIRLVPLLTGKTLEAYARLSEDSSGNYNLIKDAILKRYQLTSEAYREKLSVSRQQNDESFRDYQVRTERYCPIGVNVRTFDMTTESCMTWSYENNCLPFVPKSFKYGYMNISLTMSRRWSNW